MRPRLALLLLVVLDWSKITPSNVARLMPRRNHLLSAWHMPASPAALKFALSISNYLELIAVRGLRVRETETEADGQREIQRQRDREEERRTGEKLVASRHLLEI